MSKDVSASVGKAKEAAAGQCHIGHSISTQTRWTLKARPTTVTSPDSSLFLQEDNRIQTYVCSG